MSSALSDAIHANLWNSELGCYTDLQLDGTFSNVKAESTFSALLLPSKYFCTKHD